MDAVHSLCLASLLYASELALFLQNVTQNKSRSNEFVASVITLRASRSCQRFSRPCRAQHHVKPHIRPRSLLPDARSAGTTILYTLAFFYMIDPLLALKHEKKEAGSRPDMLSCGPVPSCHCRRCSLLSSLWLCPAPQKLVRSTVP